MHFPPEVLRLVLEKSETADLLVCKHVCSSWYNVARRLLLEKVALNNVHQFEKLIEWIDSNPAAFELASVKRIEIYIRDYEPTREKLEKLFFHFPNLNHVENNDYLRFFQEFDDDLCKGILKSCPKLDTFVIKEIESYQGTVEGRKIFHQLRLLLTTVSGGNVMYAVGTAANVIQFIRGFPRLQQLIGDFEQLDSFDRIFPLLEELPDLKSFTVVNREGGETAGFVKDFLTTKSLEEQAKFLTRLTKITELGLKYHENFCTNTIKFITKYLPVLESFAITSSKNTSWTELHKELFFSDILQLICTLKNTRFDFSKFMAADMLNYLPIIAQSIICQPQDKSTKKWGLYLHISYKHGYSGEVDLRISIDRTKSLKRISTSATNGLDISDVISGLFDTIPTLTNVDKLVLSISANRPSHYVDSITYENILYKLPALKEIKLTLSLGRVQNLSTAMCPTLQKLSLYFEFDREIWNDNGFVIDVVNNYDQIWYNITFRPFSIRCVDDLIDEPDIKKDSLLHVVVGTSLQRGIRIVTLGFQI